LGESAGRESGQTLPESRDFPMPFTDELIAADIPDPIPVGRLPVVPIAASVGLHALLSLLFLNLAPRTGELHGPPERTAITVNLRQFEKPEVEIPQEVAELPAPSESVGIVQSETEEPEEPLPDSLEDKTDMESPVEPEVAVLNSGIAAGSAGYADDEVGQPFLDTAD
jgi:hypothetical protein